MYYQFYQTILENKERLNINHAVKRANIPFLMIHGTADEAVAYYDAEELKKKCETRPIVYHFKWRPYLWSKTSI
jgi:fermentation-respiration switch protein FrsA (DUF1100 family)